MALRESQGAGSDQLSSGNPSLKITLIAGYLRRPMPQSDGHNTESLGAGMMGQNVSQTGKMGGSGLVVRQHWNSTVQG
jgi:hypothetical protein